MTQTVKHKARLRKRLVSAAEAPATDGDSPAPPAAAKQARRDAAARWTKDLVEGGFTTISNFFLTYSWKLKPEITPGESLFIIHLMQFKWDEKMPFPAYKTIAQRMGIGHAQARKLARKLESKKYLIRHVQVSKTNRFDLQPLFTALENLRTKVLAERKAKDSRRKLRKI